MCPPELGWHCQDWEVLEERLGEGHLRGAGVGQKAEVLGGADLAEACDQGSKVRTRRWRDALGAVWPEKGRTRSLGEGGPPRVWGLEALDPKRRLGRSGDGSGFGGSTFNRVLGTEGLLQWVEGWWG